MFDAQNGMKRRNPKKTFLPLANPTMLNTQSVMKRTKRASLCCAPAGTGVFTVLGGGQGDNHFFVTAALRLLFLAVFQGVCGFQKKCN